MNTPTTPTPDLEGLHKAVQQFQPNPRRVPFNSLKPVHDIIVDLHRRNASYATIADLLQQHGVKTSRARVAEYGRIFLDGGKKRKRRKRMGAAPIVNSPTPQSMQPWPQNPRRSRQRRRMRQQAMTCRHQKKVLHIGHAARASPT
jgi:hypothetical protein